MRRSSEIAGRPWRDSSCLREITLSRGRCPSNASGLHRARVQGQLSRSVPPFPRAGPAKRQTQSTRRGNARLTLAAAVMAILPAFYRPAPSPGAIGRFPGKAKKSRPVLCLARLAAKSQAFCGGDGRSATLVLRFVDQSVGGNPRHHRAQLFTDLLYGMFGAAPAHCLEARLTRRVLEHPFA